MSSPRYQLEASRAHGHGTINVALVTTPVCRHSKTPTLAEWHDPRSSALMMTTRASAGYPSRWASVGSLTGPRHLGILGPGDIGDAALEFLHGRRERRVADRQNPHRQQ